MTTAKLKNLIVKKISKIDDDKFLYKIHKFVENINKAHDVNKLNDFQKKKIKKSKAQITKGLGIPNGKVFGDLRKLLNLRNPEELEI